MESMMMSDEAETRSVGVAFGSTESVNAMTQRKLIRTAELSLEVDGSEEAVKKVETIAREAGGFVGTTSLRRYDDGSHSGSVTVRVPLEKFDDVIKQLRELGKVQQLSTNVQDVTGQYVDLDARLRNKKREEEELLKLFDRKGELEDIIQIESRLSEVREQVEVFEGQMRVLSEQIALSTINVFLAEKGEAAVAEVEGYDLGYHLRSAGRSFMSVVQGLVTFLIYFVVVGWVFWLPIGLLVWFVRRRRIARANEKSDAPAD